MKLVFIGSGSAFIPHEQNYQSNILLIDEKTNKKLLMDCGSDARHALGDLGYSYQDINAVYISHLHADHVGGLEWLALSTKFNPSCQKPDLYANKEVMGNLWEHSLSGGMSTLQGVNANLETFFETHPIAENAGFLWENIHFQTVRTVHVVSGFTFMPSYGLLFTLNGMRIFITTDTQFMPNQLVDFYRDSDIIFQDCETSPARSKVHAHFEELITLDESIRAKMWLYHHNVGALPNATEHGFRGFVQRGQIFEF